MKLFCLTLVSALLLKGHGERTKKKIYFDVETSARAACFRRLNGTHQIGCSSDPKGNVGVVHYVETDADLEWLLKSGPHQPYAVLLRASYFNMTTLWRLQVSGKVNGIMVMHLKNMSGGIEDTPQGFSPDSSCPNDQYGLYSDSEKYKGCSNIKWNDYGEGMMFRDISFPIFILTKNSDLDFIINNCYEKFNKPDNVTGAARDYPLCAVQLKDRMDGAKDSETCIRRTRQQDQTRMNPDKYCDPMGDQNVYVTTKSINSTETRDNRSVVIAAARMDSFSMFEGFYPSADNHVSGIVALLAVAEVLGQDAIKEKLRSPEVKKDLMLTFFQGEAFDYIGSERMVYDMQHGKFPLKYGTHLSQIGLPNIAQFVEVNQLANRDNGKLWIHTDPITRQLVSNETDDLIKDLQAAAPGMFDTAPDGNPLPPASVQSFLKKVKNHPFPAIVLTDHQRSYTNRFYNSRFDLASSIKVSYPPSIGKDKWYNYVTPQAADLATVATSLARFLYKTVTGETAPPDMGASNKTVTHLLYCFLISPKCELFKEILPADKANTLAAAPYQMYVGVDYQTNEYTALTQTLLLRYLGDKRPNVTKDQCDDMDDKSSLYNCVWMQGPLNVNNTRTNAACYCGTSNYSVASSIAFELDDYDYTSGQYSTWAESSWAQDAMNVRFFLIPSKKFEVVTLVVGVVILLASLGGGYLLDKKSSVLFSTSGSLDSASSPVSL